MTHYVEERRDAFGVELIREIHAARVGYRRVYGVRKTWKELKRRDVEAGRDHVARLMGEQGMQGVVRGRKAPRTTIADQKAARPADLVDRRFSAKRPNQLWVCDFTYCWTLDGVCYAAFILDVYSRKLVGWQLSPTMRTELVLDALEMALHQRRIEQAHELVHHSDAGSQYTSIVYSERLADQGVAASIGSIGDAYITQSGSCVAPLLPVVV